MVREETATTYCDSCEKEVDMTLVDSGAVKALIFDKKWCEKGSIWCHFCAGCYSEPEHVIENFLYERSSEAVTGAHVYRGTPGRLDVSEFSDEMDEVAGMIVDAVKKRLGGGE